MGLTSLKSYESPPWALGEKKHMSKALKPDWANQTMRHPPSHLPQRPILKLLPANDLIAKALLESINR